MAWVISVLGAILGLAGAWSLWNGVSFIRIDWGQTETVAGTVALSAGVVTLGLGAVLFALRDLRLAYSLSSQTGADGLGALEPAAVPDEAGPSRPAGAVSRLKSKLATVGMPRTEPSVPEIAAAPEDLDRPSLRPALAPAESERSVPPISPPPHLRPAPEVPEPPTVVGRYDANGATYILFSDGTIEVETESGTHRFDSMADLKAHIERQEQA